MLVLWARRSLEFACCKGQGGKGGQRATYCKVVWKLESVVKTGIEVDHKVQK